MPRSSRSKSHNQSKNNSKEVVKERSEDCEVDIMNVCESNGDDFVSSVRVSKDLVCLEKRKFDMFGDCDSGGDLVDDDVVVSKRRKERGEKSRGKEERVEKLREREVKVEKSKEVKVEKSKEVRVEKSNGKELKVEKSKRKEVNVEKLKEVRVENLRGKEAKEVKVEKSKEVEVEKSKGIEVKVEKSKGMRVEKSKGKEVKENVEVERKSRGDESERKVEVEVRSEGRDESKRKGGKDGNECRKDVEVAKKRTRSVDGSRDREVKRGRGIAAKDDIQNHEVEKELEKKVLKRVDYLGDKSKHQDDMKNSVDKRSSRGDCSKDARHKDERHRDKYREDDDKDIRQREYNLRKDGDRSSRYKDATYQEDAEKKNRHRDEKYSKDSYRDNRHRDDKYCKDGGVDTRHKEDKYPEHGDKYDKNDRHNGFKNGEDSKTIQQKEVKRHEHIQWDSRQRDAKQKAESDRDRGEMAQDVKFMDMHISKDPDSESEMKHTRNEIDAVDPNQRKSSNYDSCPTYDDGITNYKSDMVKRRLSDKEGLSDVRYASINEQNSDMGKNSMSSGKVNIVTERGWSSSRKTDVDTSVDHNCRRNSPNSSTHEARDHYRVSIPEESNHREYGYEENVRHNRKSSREFPCAGRTENRPSARPVEKYAQKDDSHFGELSHHRLDARASPLRLAHKSPSSVSTERRHSNSSEIRRTLDIEESATRRGSSRDHSVVKEKAGLDLQKEVHLVDKLSKAERESSSDLPILKSNNNPSRSYLPPPFRTRLDCPLPFGYSEDDTRGRSNNYHRRNSNSNTGSLENAWKGVPNWPSHVPNGFMPLQHVPPVNFHPVMQQFPAPQIYGVRPTMDLNNALPFHIPFTENFHGHGRPLGWQNPVDDSCPPVNGWDAHTHGYVRSAWDQNRGQINRRGRDTNADLPFGKNDGISGDLPSISQKEDSGAAIEASAGQSGQQAHSELNNPYSQEYSLDVQSCDPLGNIIAEAPMDDPKKSRDSSEIFGEDNASLCHIYLSRLDISTDLTQPDLYNKLTSLINVDQIKAEKDNYMIIYMEEKFECNLANEIQTDAPLGNDLVFQNAMSLYKKQREDIRAMNKRKVFSSNIEIPEVFQTHNNEKAHLGCNKLEKEVLSSLNGSHTNSAVSDYLDSSSGLREAEASSVTAFQKSDEPCVTNIVVVSRDHACMLNETEMGVDPVFRQKLGDFITDNKSAMQITELSKALSRGNLEEMKKSDDLQSNMSASNSEDNKLIDTKCSVSSGACEALMPDLVEFESVYPHHYSESTH